MKKLIAAGALALALTSGASLAEEAAPEGSAIVEMTLGSEDAKVKMTEYASFTCPHCAQFHEDVFKKLRSDYIDTGKVQFTYRDVYFDSAGVWAAMVARCGGQEKFFGISDMLFTTQREWSKGEPAEVADNLRRIGKVAGIDSDKLEACLSDRDKAKALVAWYQANAEADGVDSTPTLFINGEKHTNMSYEDLKAILDAKLAE